MDTRTLSRPPHEPSCAMRDYGTMTSCSCRREERYTESLELALAAANERIREAEKDIQRLRHQVKDMSQEIRDTARDAAAEAAWKGSQGGDYGSY